MKAFFALAVLSLVASALASPLELSDEQKAKAKNHLEVCAKEENVSDEVVAKFRNKDYENASQELKCLSTCFFGKTGTFKDGKLQDEVVIAKLGPLIGEEKTKQILEKCKGIEAGDRCETGFKTHLCFHSAQAAV